VGLVAIVLELKNKKKKSTVKKNNYKGS
jgi:hypothetical protein